MVPFLCSKERNVMTEIEVKHLSKTFEQKGMHVDALRDTTLRLRREIFTELSECPVQERVLWYDV